MKQVKNDESLCVVEKRKRMKTKDFSFRIWNGERFVFSPSLLINEYSSSNVVIGTVMGDHFDHYKVHGRIYGNKVEIELWTGLKDIDGNKIFEGDIVEDTKMNEGFKYRVVYAKDTAGFTLRILSSKAKDADQTGIFCKSEVKRRGFKVIGNIHEKKGGKQ